MEKSTQKLDEAILAAFMSLTEENQMLVLAMAARITESGAA